MSTSRWTTAVWNNLEGRETRTKLVNLMKLRVTELTEARELAAAAKVKEAIVLLGDDSFGEDAAWGRRPGHD